MPVYKGWNAKIYYQGVQIGYADSASVEIATNVEAYYQIGSRRPVDLVTGNEEVTGSISKAWIDKNYLQLVAPGETSLSTFNLCFDSGSVKIYCYDCVFERGSVDIPQDGVLKEDYDFRAKTVAIV